MRYILKKLFKRCPHTKLTCRVLLQSLPAVKYSTDFFPCNPIPRPPLQSSHLDVRLRPGALVAGQQPGQVCGHCGPPRELRLRPAARPPHEVPAGEDPGPAAQRAHPSAGVWLRLRAQHRRSGHRRRGLRAARPRISGGSGPGSGIDGCRKRAGRGGGHCCRRRLGNARPTREYR